MLAANKELEAVSGLNEEGGAVSWHVPVRAVSPLDNGEHPTPHLVVGCRSSLTYRSPTPWT